METVNYDMIPVTCKVMANVSGQDVPLNLVGEVGSHEKSTTQIQDFHIKIHCSLTLHVGEEKRFRAT